MTKHTLWAALAALAAKLKSASFAEPPPKPQPVRLQPAYPPPRRVSGVAAARRAAKQRRKRR